MCDNASCKKKDLFPTCDVAGNHGRVCHPGVKGQNALTLERTLEKVFRAAGGMPTRQPSTYSLLGGLFPKDDLSSLFCGNLSKAESEDRRVLAMKYLDVISERSPDYQRDEELAALKSKYPKPSAKGDEDNNGIVRFDLKFPAVGPEDCPRELWFDHAIVHETSPSYAQDTLRVLKDAKERVSAGKAFQKMLTKKTAKYSSLVSVVNRLSKEHKLDAQPSFLTPIISSLGFMNDDFRVLLKFVVDRFKDSQKTAPRRMDGLSPKTLSGRFKVQVRNSIGFALLKANALATYNQGTHQTVKPP